MTQTHARTQTRSHTCTYNPHMTVTNVISLSSNSIACIIHEYFNRMSIIRHNMPTLLKQGNSGRRGENGKIEWEGVTSMYDNMNSHQKAALSRVWLSRGSCASTLSHHPPPPAVLTDYYYGNPLAYACKTTMCETGKFTALLHVLDWIYLILWWKCINVTGTLNMITFTWH